MKGYCKSCKRKVQGINSKGSWVITALITIIATVIWIPLGIVALVFCLFCDVLPWNKNRCPLCGLKIK